MRPRQNPRVRRVQVKNQAIVEHRRAEVAKRLLAGKSQNKIAKELAVSPSTVNLDVKAILAEWRRHYVDTTDSRIALHLRRYEELIEGLWEKARAGDVAAVDRVAMLMRQAEDLLGLRQTKIDITSGQQPIQPVTFIEIHKYDTAVPGTVIESIPHAPANPPLLERG
jgi:DNA-binding CsgD family transcriptional regulator